MKKVKRSTSEENRARAPICAAFVAEMREVFGADQVKVLFVKEGSVEMGNPCTTEPSSLTSR